MLRDELLAVARELLARSPSLISLDEVAEALGTLAVTSEEIDALLTFLESHGRRVGEGVEPASSALGAVLTAARSLKRELGRTPSTPEIAERSGLSLEVVRRALLFAQIVQR